MIALVFLISFIQSIAYGATDKCDFKLDCGRGTSQYQLSFQSPSGDCSEDDMQLTAHSRGRNSKLKIDPKLYFFTEHISKNLESRCRSEDDKRRFTAYSLNSDHLILFVKSSGRPGYDRVIAIAIETKNWTTIDSLDLGPSKNQYIAVLKSKAGFKLRIVRESLSLKNQVTCDCDAAHVDDWLEVRFISGRLKSRWL